jgi:hypothetical protein
VRELVIVVPDLYLPVQAERARLSAQAQSPSLPGLDHLGRFARSARLERDWRDFAARWLGLGALARHAPASVAAAALAMPLEAPTVWFATPLHLIAGSSGVHLDRRGILRPPPAELEELAQDFAQVFRGSGHALRPLAGGELLLGSPPLAPTRTTEPARALLAGVAESLPRGAGAAALLKLGAELEMWLHAHALNERRARGGAPAVSTLWVWGGGGPAVAARAAAGGPADVVFGSDPYVRGLLALASRRVEAMPADGRAVIGYPRAERALCVLEIAEMLQARPRWSLGDALAELDARLVRPALEALARGQLARLALIANDRRLELRPGSRWRLWRRRRSGLEALA